MLDSAGDAPTHQPDEKREVSLATPATGYMLLLDAAQPLCKRLHNAVIFGDDGTENLEIVAAAVASVVVMDSTPNKQVVFEEADIVFGKHMFNRAACKKMLERIARLLAQNLKCGGRLAMLVVHPDHPVPHATYSSNSSQWVGFPFADGSRLQVHKGNRTHNWHYWPSDAITEALRLAGFIEIDWIPGESTNMVVRAIMS